MRESARFAGSAAVPDHRNPRASQLPRYLDAAQVEKMLVRMEGRILLRLEQHVQGLKAQIDGIDRSAKDVSKELRAMLERILLAQAGEHFRSGEPSEPARAAIDEALDTLTPRKRDVAVLIRSGMSNYCISQHLRITENTVKTHVSQLLKHFGMSNRTKLAAFLLSHQ